MLLVGGCDRFLKLEKVAAKPDAPPCSSPAVFDAFEDPAPPLCGSWAKTDNSPAWMTRDQGRLLITPVPSGSGFVACDGSEQFHFDDGGVFVHVSELGVDSAFGVLEVSTFTDAGDPSPNAQTTFAFTGTKITLYDQLSCNPDCTDLAKKDYVLGEMSWFRLRPTDAGTSITAEYSGDGWSWTPLGTRVLSGGLASYIEPTVGGGANGGVSPTRTAFDSFDVCPDQPGS